MPEECPIVGSAKDLADCSLPSVADVLRYYDFCLIERKKVSPQQPSVSSICDILVPNLVSLWKKLQPSVTVLSNPQIKKLISSLHSEHIALQRVNRTRRKKPASFDKNLSDFKAKSNLVFNISVCKCQQSKCTCQIFHKRFEPSPSVTPPNNNTPDNDVRETVRLCF